MTLSRQRGSGEAGGRVRESLADALGVWFVGVRVGDALSLY